MRIISLDPSLTELVYYFGLGESLVGVSSRCDFIEIPQAMPRVTEFRGKPYADPVKAILADNLSSDYLVLDKLQALQPDTVITISWDYEDDEDLKSQLRDCLCEFLGYPARLFMFNPHNLPRLLDMFESLGKDLKVPDKGHSLAQRAKAQFMNWSDNFYERTRNKKVTFLAGIDPFLLGGRWIPDIVRGCSALPQNAGSRRGNEEVSWDEIRSFRPDVLIVAPAGMPIRDARRSFMDLEKLPGWDDIPAVKRGEVFFSDGEKYFFRATPSIVESGAVIISAIAGLEAGYISDRESMFRLRFLEMNRHKL